MRGFRTLPLFSPALLAPVGLCKVGLSAECSGQLSPLLFVTVESGFRAQFFDDPFLTYSPFQVIFFCWRSSDPLKIRTMSCDLRRASAPTCLMIVFESIFPGFCRRIPGRFLGGFPRRFLSQGVRSLFSPFPSLFLRGFLPKNTPGPPDCGS